MSICESGSGFSFLGYTMKTNDWRHVLQSEGWVVGWQEESETMRIICPHPLGLGMNK